MNTLKSQYNKALHLEGQIQQLISELPPEPANLTGISLWRACVAVSHYINEIDKNSPMSTKSEAFYYAKNATEKVIRLLKQFEGQGFNKAGELIRQYRFILADTWQTISKPLPRLNSTP